nr:DNA-directed DNA polymerase [Tanacetum cinerariifolium]
MDKEQTNFQGSIAHIQSLVTLILELDVLKTLPRPNIPYPSRLDNQKLREKATNQMEKFFQIFQDLHFDITDRSITHPKGVAEDIFIKVGKFHFPTDFVVVDFEVDPQVPLILGRSFLRTGRALIDVYGEEITLRVNDESDTFNLNQTTRYSSTYDDLSVKRIDIINVAREEYAQEILEIEAYLKDESISPEINHADRDPEGDICLIEKLLNNDPFQLPLIDLKQGEVAKVLKSHKREIAWKIIDIKGIDLQFCTHKILMEDDYKLAILSQRRVNPKIHEVIKKEVIKLLNAEMIYLILDSLWVSPIHCVPKKGGITVVENENNELIPTRLVTGWRVCIYYRKINDATRKDHFSPLSMDQMLEQLVGNAFYCFLDGFFGYIQIPINLPDQEKSTFTCPYGTFAYRRMPFVLCNAPGTFQRCMMAIFHDMIGKTMEVFMDDFLVFRDSYSSCLSHLNTMLQRCEDTNLVLNWGKCHFMVKEGIVLGHKISKNRLVIDRAKATSSNDCERLENPHKDVFENKDINENFPLETLDKISSGSTPWFADFANFHAGNFIVKRISSCKRRNSLRTLNITSKTIPTFFGYARIKSFDGVCIAKKLMISSKHVMKDPPGAIMVPISPPRMYLMPVSFGQPIIEILIT